MASAKRQVLIEATIAEVQLNNQYQRGIDWQKLRNPSGLSLLPSSANAPAGLNVAANTFVLGFVQPGLNLTGTIKLLESFGDVRVLSSPKLSVLNNQTAILRVTRDIIYFTITPSTQPITIAGGGTGSTIQASFTTTPNVAAEGFMMAVMPQINESDAVVLNVRPTIRRRVDSVTDPNPALQNAATQNIIPVFETREFDSILRLQSGQVGVLAGLMQDIVERNDAGIPGIRNIPILGELLSSRADLSRKTELVIFLRATVIHDPSLEGDFASLREQLPTQDFFTRPNPTRVGPPIGPGDRPLR
jgi:general secretion pathway protein D